MVGSDVFLEAGGVLEGIAIGFAGGTEGFCESKAGGGFALDVVDWFKEDTDALRSCARAIAAAVGLGDLS